MAMIKCTVYDDGNKMSVLTFYNRTHINGITIRGNIVCHSLALSGQVLAGLNNSSSLIIISTRISGIISTQPFYLTLDLCCYQMMV